MKRYLPLVVWLLGACFAFAAAPVRSLPDALKTVRAVGPEGQGNAAASVAWQTVTAQPVEKLPEILQAMDGANELAVNWLRAAVDTLASRARSNRAALPLKELETYLRDARHHPRGRAQAFELIAQAEPQRAEKMIAGMLDDPSPDLRRQAVQRLSNEAQKLSSAGQTNEAVTQFQIALKSAREPDQVELIAGSLKKLGHPVSLPTVFGWLMKWKVIGPFDSTGGAGFDRVYPPEEKINLAAEYPGKNGPVRWQDYETKQDYGLVDLNQPLGTLKGVAGYAYKEFYSPAERPVELRLGCKNAWKVWLNGEFLFGRDEYHRGREIDQYRMTAVLKPGTNAILVKVCQNEQTEDWTKEWEFQLRVTDRLGAPLSSTRN